MVICEQSARGVCESSLCTLPLPRALPHRRYTTPPALGLLLHTLESSHAATGTHVNSFLMNVQVQVYSLILPDNMFSHSSDI